MPAAAAKKAAETFKDLAETFELREALEGMQIDDANGVLKGVVLLTANKKSANNTFYRMSALEEAATRYEGASMYLDHGEKGKNRSVRDFGGTYKNLRVDGNKLKGDLELSESARKELISIAKMRPTDVGLSIKDRGRGVDQDGTFYVDGFLPGVRYSIDAVVNPSVNASLFEATQINEGGDEMDYKSLTVDVLSKERPDLIESVQNAGKAAILKDLDEAKAKGAKSDSMAAKILALVEAEFPKDVREAVQKMITPDAISLDDAKTIIAGQKQLVEALGKKAAKDPKVTGAGAGKEVTEGTELKVVDDAIFEAAFTGRR